MTNKTAEKSNKKNRKTNIELLRIVSMFFVLLLHYIPHRSIPTTESLQTNTLDTLVNLELRSLSFVGVNCFVLISGYFGINWKLKSFLNLTFQILFWPIVIFASILLISFLLPGCIVGNLDMLPIIKHDLSRWFIVSYLGLYLLSPLLNDFLKYTDSESIFKLLILFYIFSTLYGYILKVPDFNEGMSIISLCGIYITGAFLRKYKSEKFLAISATLWLSLYLGLGFLLIGISIIALDLGFTSSPYGYLNPIIILESVCLFMFFERIKLKHLKIVDWIASSCFAVYLIHTSSIVEKWFANTINKIESTNFGISTLFIGIVFLVAFYIFCVFIDKIRILIYTGCLSLSKKALRCSTKV